MRGVDDRVRALALTGIGAMLDAGASGPDALRAVADRVSARAIGEALRRAAAQADDGMSPVRVPVTRSGASDQTRSVRDKEKHEVDVVIEDHRGRVVGIEVKASATVTVSDFRGLRRLAQACGDRFVTGMVLYDHDVMVPFGEKMFATPLAALWAV